MSSSSSPTLVLELRWSWLRMLPSAMLLVAALTLPWLASAVPLGFRALCMMLALVIAAVAIWQSGVGRPAAQLAAISWGQDGQWRLQFRTGVAIAATLIGRSWLSPWLMCLKFTAENGLRHQTMLWRGELSSTAWQQWRLRLRLEAEQHSARQFTGTAA